MLSRRPFQSFQFPICTSTMWPAAPSGARSLPRRARPRARTPPRQTGPPGPWPQSSGARRAARPPGARAAPAQTSAATLTLPCPCQARALLGVLRTRIHAQRRRRERIAQHCVRIRACAAAGRTPTHFLGRRRWELLRTSQNSTRPSAEVVAKKKQSAGPSLAPSSACGRRRPGHHRHQSLCEAPQ